MYDLKMGNEMKDVGTISVIVPVYGIEQYLSECVDSILAQTYQNLEIILVDDESPDACPQICDAYAQKDGRVKVVHKKNGGAASARNAGLDIVTGEYVCLIDGDDVIEPSFVEELLTELIAHGADVSVCSFDNWFIDGRKPHGVVYPEETVMPQVEYLKRFLTDWTSGIAVNKLYRQAIVNNVRYEEGHKIDDEFFTYQAIMNAEKVAVCSKELYHYRMRKSSVMHSSERYKELILLDKIEYFQIRYQQVCDRYPVLADDFFKDMVDSFTRYWSGCKGLSMAKKQLKNWKKTNFFKIWKLRVSLKQKLIYIYALYFRSPKGAGIKVETETHILFT